MAYAECYRYCMAYLDSWLYLAHDKCRPDRDHLGAINILWHTWTLGSTSPMINVTQIAIIWVPSIFYGILGLLALPRP